MDAHNLDYPLIAAVTKPDQLEAALTSHVKRINLLTGDIMQLHEIVDRVHLAGKELYVHIEMVNGIGKDSFGIQYLIHKFKIDGVVSTKSNVIATAKQAGIGTTQRIFAIDTAAIFTAFKMLKSSQPHEVELMPGLMPRIIREVREYWDKKLIVGGLIRSEEEIQSAFDNGADYVSVGDPRFWNVN